MMAPMSLGEFDLIERYFWRPAGVGPQRAVVGNGDDCAVIAPQPGYRFKVTLDVTSGHGPEARVLFTGCLSRFLFPLAVPTALDVRAISRPLQPGPHLQEIAPQPGHRTSATLDIDVALKPRPFS